MKKMTYYIDKFTDFIGYIAAFALLLMLCNIFYDVIMRYFFQNSAVAMQEMEWHLFSVVFLFGIAYTLKENAHVRVDILYDGMSSKKQALVNIIGTLIFVIPFSLVIINSGYTFAYEAYEIGEISSDPGGLTQRWIIKSAISISFLFLLVATLSFIVHNILKFFNQEDLVVHKHKDEVL